MPRKNIEEQKNDTPKERNEKGQFTKGRAKTGGRKMGVKNKNTNLRDSLKEQCAPLLEDLGTQLMMIKDVKDRLDTLSKFVPFFLPKFSSTNITADTDRPISEEERLEQLDTSYTKKQTEISIKTLTIIDNDNGGAPLSISADDLTNITGPSTDS